MKDQESVLELGLLLLAVGIAVGGGFWIAGRVWGRGQSGRRYAAQPPEAGAIAAERHQHISAVAAR